MNTHAPGLDTHNVEGLGKHFDDEWQREKIIGSSTASTQPTPTQKISFWHHLGFRQQSDPGTGAGQIT
jgi:hypothetical protein